MPVNPYEQRVTPDIPNAPNPGASLPFAQQAEGTRELGRSMGNALGSSFKALGDVQETVRRERYRVDVAKTQQVTASWKAEWTAAYTELMAQEGTQAEGLVDQAGSTWSKIYERHASGLSPDQQALFGMVVNEERPVAFARLTIHQRQQSEVVQKQAAVAIADLSSENVVLYPDERNLKVQQDLAFASIAAATRNAPPEVRVQAQRRWADQTHRAVVTAASLRDDVQGARGWLAAHHTQMDPVTVAELESRLAAKGEEIDAIRMVDDAVRNTVDERNEADWGAARESLEKVRDGEVSKVNDRRRLTVEKALDVLDARREKFRVVQARADEAATGHYLGQMAEQQDPARTKLILSDAMQDPRLSPASKASLRQLVETKPAITKEQKTLEESRLAQEIATYWQTGRQNPNLTEDIVVTRTAQLGLDKGQREALLTAYSTGRFHDIRLEALATTWNSMHTGNGSPTTDPNKWGNLPPEKSQAIFQYVINRSRGVQHFDDVEIAKWLAEAEVRGIAFGPKGAVLEKPMYDLPYGRAIPLALVTDKALAAAVYAGLDANAKDELFRAGADPTATPVQNFLRLVERARPTPPAPRKAQPSTKPKAQGLDTGLGAYAPATPGVKRARARYWEGYAD